MDWVYKFMKRFCKENFEIDLDSMIPLKWIFVFVVEEVRGEQRIPKNFQGNHYIDEVTIA